MFTERNTVYPQVNITVNSRTGSGWQSGNLAGLAPRFWAKVRRGGLNECWLWSASTTGTGLPYGQFTLPRDLFGGRQVHVYAHRIAWVLTYGAIPDGLNVCHRCDVSRCCNPNHLFVGTQAENLADCRQKGRMPRRRRRKLSDADVVAIRRASQHRGEMAQLARELGVSATTVSHVARGRRHACVGHEEIVGQTLTGRTHTFGAERNRTR
jgi:hypothetical protein